VIGVVKEKYEVVLYKNYIDYTYRLNAFLYFIRPEGLVLGPNVGSYTEVLGIFVAVLDAIIVGGIGVVEVGVDADTFVLLTAAAAVAKVRTTYNGCIKDVIALWLV